MAKLRHLRRRQMHKGQAWRRWIQMMIRMSNRITPKLHQVTNSQLNFSKISLILKSPNKNTGVPSQRNLQAANNHLNKWTVVIMKTFLDFATPARRCICALSFQTIIPRQSLSSVLAGNRPRCMKLGIFVASKNI